MVYPYLEDAIRKSKLTKNLITIFVISQEVNLEYNLVVTLPAICHIITHFGPEMLIPNDSPLAERSARRRSNESHNNIILIALTFDRFEDHMPLGQNLIRRTKAFS